MDIDLHSSKKLNILEASIVLSNNLLSNYTLKIYAAKYVHKTRQEHRKACVIVLVVNFARKKNAHRPTQ